MVLFCYLPHGEETKESLVCDTGTISLNDNSILASAAKFFHVFQKIHVTSVAGFQKIVSDMMVVGVIAMNTTTSPPINKRPLRRALLALTVLLMFIIGCFIVIAFIPPRRLHIENFSQVRIGMTQSEVETLLGGPPGNYGKIIHDMTVKSAEEYLHPPDSVKTEWCDDSNMIEIYFSPQLQVVGIHKRFTYCQSQVVAPGSWVWFRLWIRQKTGW